jgi:6-pyruvoyltetrahydropterin/6-carboxytetrahydropterin synthase
MPDANLHQPSLVLARKVRFAINAQPRTDRGLSNHGAPNQGASNSFAGKPGMEGFGRHYEVTLRCRDRINAQQQYVRDIKLIDQAAHTHIISKLHSAALSTSPETPHPAMVLAGTLDATNIALAGILCDVTLHLTPTYSLMISTNNRGRVTLRQRFDFAASHRLHNPDLDESGNRSAYGKCNNPRGHGHNYQFEPAVSVPLHAAESGAFLLHHLENAAQRAIIERFDHTHLNEDTAEFNVSKGGLIPTVENISYVLYGLLKQELATVYPGAELTSMTVWETDRTCATFP